jgi:hypothetical protein
MRESAPHFPPKCILFGTVLLGPRTGREPVGALLTRKDDLCRTAEDPPTAFAKVGVAGSNPVVRSGNIAVYLPLLV